MSKCLVKAFEFHALGCQAFRRGSGICQRPLTEDSSELDKIHGPNFFFLTYCLCSLAFCWVLRFSNFSFLTMEIPNLKIQDYPYFSISKRKLAFIRTHCIAMYAVARGRGFCPCLGKQQSCGGRSRVTSFIQQGCFEHLLLPGTWCELEMER